VAITTAAKGGPSTSSPLSSVVQGLDSLTHSVDVGVSQGNEVNSDISRIETDLGLIPPPATPAPSAPSGAVVGLVIGGLVLLGLVGVVLYIVRRGHR